MCAAVLPTAVVLNHVVLGWDCTEAVYCQRNVNAEERNRQQCSTEGRLLCTRSLPSPLVFGCPPLMHAQFQLALYPQAWMDIPCHCGSYKGLCVCVCVCVCTASYQASFEPGSQGTVPTGTLEAHKQNLRRACLSKITWSEDESMFASYHELDAVRH